MISRFQLLRALIIQKADPCRMSVWLAIRRVLQDCPSILDVGCGSNSLLPALHPPALTGIDGFEPAVAEARRKGAYKQVLHGDIRQLSLLFQPDQFDACIAIDVIEHLTKEEGQQLAHDMEQIASKKVVFFTPKGFLPQQHSEQGDLQEHHSGWEPAEMEQLGYRVRGYLGPQSWRGSYHVLRYRPRFLWALAAYGVHLLWTHRNPQSAAAILCAKKL
jgi:SAM-dependent methyltransferase